MTVTELITFLQTLDQDLPIAYQCYSEAVLMTKDEIMVSERCLPREDGWVHHRRPDKPFMKYLLFPGN